MPDDSPDTSPESADGEPPSGADGTTQPPPPPPPGLPQDQLSDIFFPEQRPAEANVVFPNPDGSYSPPLPGLDDGRPFDDNVPLDHVPDDLPDDVLPPVPGLDDEPLSDDLSDDLPPPSGAAARQRPTPRRLPTRTILSRATPG